MKSKDIIKIQVGHWGESVSMFALLVDKMVDKDGVICGFGRKEWFPKSICEVERVENYKNETYPTAYNTAHVLSCPRWLLEKKEVKYNEDQKE